MAEPKPTRRRIRVLVVFNQLGTPESERESPRGKPKRPRGPGLWCELEPLVSSLKAEGFAVSCVNLEDDIDRVGHAVVVLRPDVIVNMVDQMWGDTMNASAVCQLYDLYGYGFLGSDPVTQATCLDRARTRLVLDDAGVAVPAYVIVRDLNAVPDTEDFTPPLVVSQAYDDTYEYEGYHNPLTTREALLARIASLATEYDMPLLVEEFVDARYVQAIVMGNRALEVLPLTERYYDEGKGAEVMGLARLDDIAVVDRVKLMARRSFRAMGCRDLAQIDLCIGDDGAAWVIDVRPAVDLSAESAFYAAAEATERGYSGCLALALQTALQRIGVVAPLPVLESEAEEELADDAEEPSGDDGDDDDEPT